MSLRPAGLILVLLAVPVLLAGCADTPAPVTAPSEPVAEVPSLLQPEPKMEVAAIPPPPAPVRFAGHVASYKTLIEAEAALPRLAERFRSSRPSTGGMSKSISAASAARWCGFWSAVLPIVPRRWTIAAACDPATSTAHRMICLRVEHVN